VVASAGVSAELHADETEATVAARKYTDVLLCME
jgi:hypothetical protein